MRLIQFLLLLGSAGLMMGAPVTVPTRSVPGHELFAGSSVRRFKIKVEEPDLTVLKKENRHYVKATLTDGLDVYQDVGIHLKGMGSFQPLEKKPSLVVKFDYEKPRQRYQGLSKFMLNNASQDGTYLAEYMGTSLFRDAGLPAARVTHAFVEFNGRDMGLFVLIEPMNKEFLGLHFKSVRGNLYEAYLHDVDQPMEQDSGKVTNQKDIQALAAAAKEVDPVARWKKLEEVLAVDDFIKYLVLEVFTGHTDGYANNFNNYRVYHDTEDDKLHFITHGIDWAFQSTGFPIRPGSRGLVARSILQTPEGRRRYKQYFPEMFRNLFKLEILTNRVNAVEMTLRAAMRNPEEIKMVENGATEMRNRLVQRHKFISDQLALPEATPVKLDSAGVATLAGWYTKKDSGEPIFDQPKDGEKETLHIDAGKGPSIASWRTRYAFPAGKYKIQGKVRAMHVDPQESETGSGAGVRISGGKRKTKAVGDTAWTQLEEEFEVMEGGDDITLVAELRAKKGEAWFDLSSLKVIRTR
ncbi:MAG TPA: CotH kinase family protein [Candidatus Saccharimonadales bacterium]|nr:CotH kinase family protein [Candidatus Saccharimonadales bacterium]